MQINTILKTDAYVIVIPFFKFKLNFIHYLILNFLFHIWLIIYLNANKYNSQSRFTCYCYILFSNLN